MNKDLAVRGGPMRMRAASTSTVVAEGGRDRHLADVVLVQSHIVHLQTGGAIWRSVGRSVSAADKGAAG